MNLVEFGTGLFLSKTPSEEAPDVMSGYVRAPQINVPMRSCYVLPLAATVNHFDTLFVIIFVYIIIFIYPNRSSYRKIMDTLQVFESVQSKSNDINPFLKF